jgi:hypothetical protein
MDTKTCKINTLKFVDTIEFHKKLTKILKYCCENNIKYCMDIICNGRFNQYYLWVTDDEEKEINKIIAK